MRCRRLPGIVAAVTAVLLWFPGAARPADLGLTVDVPDEEVADWPFEVTTTWSTEAARVLSLAFLEAKSCGENMRAGLELDPAALVVIEETVTEAGSRVDEVTLVRQGSYLACGYLQSSSDPAAPADVVAQSAIEITAFPGTEPSAQTGGIACGNVGGPRRITRVRAFAVRCRTARRVARRWGRGSGRGVVGEYRCRTRGRKVRCTASESRKVTFRFRCLVQRTATAGPARGRSAHQPPP
jgi:hypothetical protein